MKFETVYKRSLDMCVPPEFNIAELQDETEHRIFASRIRKRTAMTMAMAVITIAMISGCGVVVEKALNQQRQETVTYDVPGQRTMVYENGERVTYSISLEADGKRSDERADVDELTSSAYDELFFDTVGQELGKGHDADPENEVAIGEESSKELLNKIFGDEFIKEVHIKEVKQD